ncbi:hypothetical protein HHI36_001983 [Cryptolaemus montrouzieri]|uniref:Uncharacterized protein n=1 Tax=Cryptolaemus montrouzieri TaxID=559131 RepID=A0ABD2P9K5_9CUCU
MQFVAATGKFTKHGGGVDPAAHGNLARVDDMIRMIIEKYFFVSYLFTQLSWYEKGKHQQNI